MAETTKTEPKVKGSIDTLRASAERVLDQVELDRRMKQTPYVVLGVALGAGYVLGGGLFSSMTRLAFGALLVPMMKKRLTALAGELAEAATSGKLPAARA